MSDITALIEFLKTHDSLAYLILFLGSYFETLIGPGFFIQGEIFFLSGSILAGLGYLNVWLVFLYSVLGGVAGDSSSYFLGKKYGKKIYALLFRPDNKYLNPKNFANGKRFFFKYGDKSVFFARLLGPISWITPFLAGIFKLEYRKFLKYNVIGVITGIGQFIAIGYLIGFSYFKVIPYLSKYYLPALLVLIVAIISIYKTSGGKNLIRRVKSFIIRQVMKYGIIIGILYVIIYVTILYIIVSL